MPDMKQIKLLQISLFTQPYTVIITIQDHTFSTHDKIGTCRAYDIDDSDSVQLDAVHSCSLNTVIAAGGEVCRLGLNLTSKTCSYVCKI